MIEWWWQQRRWRRRLNCCDSDCLDGATMIWWLYNDSDDDDDTRMIGWLYEWLLRCSDEPFHIFKLMYQLIVVFAVGAVVGWRWRYNDDLIVAWWWSYMMWRWWQRRDCCDDCIIWMLGNNITCQVPLKPIELGAKNSHVGIVQLSLALAGGGWDKLSQFCKTVPQHVWSPRWKQGDLTKVVAHSLAKVGEFVPLFGHVALLLYVGIVLLSQNSGLCSTSFFPIVSRDMPFLSLAIFSTWCT